MWVMTSSLSRPHQDVVCRIYENDTECLVDERSFLNEFSGGRGCVLK